MHLLDIIRQINNGRTQKVPKAKYVHTNRLYCNEDIKSFSGFRQQVASTASSVVSSWLSPCVWMDADPAAAAAACLLACSTCSNLLRASDTADTCGCCVPVLLVTFVSTWTSLPVLRTDSELRQVSGTRVSSFTGSWGGALPSHSCISRCSTASRKLSLKYWICRWHRASIEQLTSSDLHGKCVVTR